MAHGGASGKVSTSTTTTTKPEESSALRRKREEILQRSMEVFGRELDKWLDYRLAEPMKRVGKRARAVDDNDSGVEDGGSATVTTTSSSSAAKIKSQAPAAVRNTKKRAKREPPEATAITAPAPAPVPSRSTPASPTGGDVPTPLFACPFYAHDPAKYKSVKTCCGPGWNNTHRVKEHIYRRHCIKHTCPRCCEQFKSDEELKHHQRLDEPCKKRNRVVDTRNNNVITDEQEKQIRTRAKTNQPEEEKWRELYRIIFSASRKIPSPYYEQTATTVKAEDEPRSVNAVPPAPFSPPNSFHGHSARRSARGLESIQFKDEAELVECRQHIHQNLNRRVRPLLEQEVDKMLRSVQHAMAQKVTEVCKEVCTKLFRTWQFGNEQTRSQSQTPASTPSPHGGSQTPTSVSYTEASYDNGGYNDHHRKLAEEVLPSTTDAGPIEVNYDQFVSEAPSMVIDSMLANGEFDLEAFLRETETDIDGVFDFSSSLGDTAAGASDSAYFSTIESTSADGSGSSASFVGARYGSIY